MPMVEIDDADLELLTLAKKAGGTNGIDMAMRAKALHDSLYNDPKLAADYHKTLKAFNPAIRTPADIAAPYVDELRTGLTETRELVTNFIDEQKKTREEADKARQQADFDAKWNAVVKDHELTEEGQEALINHMRTVGIADPEAGALHYLHKNPKPPAPVAPSSIAPSGWARDMGILHDAADTDSKALIANPEEWADREAAAVLTDIRRAA